MHCPVVAQPLGTQDKHFVIQKLKILYDSQGLECFAQTNTVSDNAAIVVEYLVDRPFDAVLLELE
ncbi:MAG: hypothetical protein DDT27_01649 [Dehalococcoidia bacterium]|nr:hypothetical protein [Chloroflexota bacterium]MBT9163080.1 hypothetical protein [Chloroflexota bacterium]